MNKLGNDLREKIIFPFQPAPLVWSRELSQLERDFNIELFYTLIIRGLKDDYGPLRTK